MKKIILNNRKETLSGWLLNLPFIVYSIVFFFDTPHMGNLAFHFELEYDISE
jgi:hypothetical protein